MKVQDFEAAVLNREGIAIRVRAPLATQVDDYDYERQASSEISVTDWLNTRVRMKLRGNDVSVIDGNGKEVHGRTKLKNVRETYSGQ